MEYINKINSQDLGYTLAVNKYADLNTEEFADMYLMTVKPKGVKNTFDKYLNPKNLQNKQKRIIS